MHLILNMLLLIKKKVVKQVKISSMK